MGSGESGGLIGDLGGATDEGGFEKMGGGAVAAGIGGDGGGGDGGGQPVGVDNGERSSQCEHHGNWGCVEIFGLLSANS